MKKKYLFTFLFLLSIIVPAQIVPEKKDLMDKEISRYQRMIDFNVNPNTLNYEAWNLIMNIKSLRKIQL